MTDHPVSADERADQPADELAQGRVGERADYQAASAMLEFEHWVIVGLRDSQIRPAWGVARYLQSLGKDIFPVHPHPEPVHGRPGYATVEQACAAIVEQHGAAALRSTVVDCFVNSEKVGAVVDEAIACGVGGVWLQLQVIDVAAVERARVAGLLALMDRCPAIEAPARGYPAAH
ncbi:MAG: CoA-binding protein [Actinomycetales bacterium]|nr:CoA-binding protein [Actinomycetales bacterium]